MKIKELRAGASNVDIRAEVVQKDDPREVVTKYGKRLSVANITLKDETGTISMSLWGDDIEKVNVGDVVEIKNAYINEFRGNPQVSTGKFGKIEVVGKSEKSSKSKNEAEDEIEDEFGEEEPMDDAF